MVPFRMEIFKAGVWTDSAGNERAWTEADLDQVAKGYDVVLHEAPAVVGHPATDAPAYGWIKSIARDGGSLVVTGEMLPELRDAVSKGLYKKRSAAFYAPDQPNNPTPGQWYLRHVGFLGAQPPAVKGLDSVQFAKLDNGECVQFEFSSQQLGVAENINILFDEENKMSGNTEELNAFQKGVEWAKGLFGHSEGVQIPQTINNPADPPKTMTEAQFSEALEKAKKEASEQAKKDAEAEFAEKEKQKAAEAAKAAHKGKVAAFCEAGVKDGKLLPAWIKGGLAQFLERLPAGDEHSYEFGDAKTKQSPYDWMVAFLDGLPKIINFEEVARRREGGDDPNLTASARLISEAGKLAKEEKISYSEALRRVAASNPALFAEYEAEKEDK